MPGRQRVYCTVKCRSAAKEGRKVGRLKRLALRQCLQCGETFQPRQSNHVCCSTPCNRKLNNYSRRYGRGPTFYRLLFIAERGGRCQSCGGDDGLEVHHILAVAEGGGHTSDNVLVLCRACHLGKHKKRPRRPDVRSPEVKTETEPPREAVARSPKAPMELTPIFYGAAMNKHHPRCFCAVCKPQK